MAVCSPGQTVAAAGREGSRIARMCSLTKVYAALSPGTKDDTAVDNVNSPTPPTTDAPLQQCCVCARRHARRRGRASQSVRRRELPARQPEPLRHDPRGFPSRATVTVCVTKRDSLGGRWQPSRRDRALFLPCASTNCTPTFSTFPLHPFSFLFSILLAVLHDFKPQKPFLFPTA